MSNPLRAGLALAFSVLAVSCLIVSQMGGRPATLVVAAQTGPGVAAAGSGPAATGAGPAGTGSGPAGTGAGPAATGSGPGPAGSGPAGTGGPGSGRRQVTPACALSLDPHAATVAPGTCTVLEVGDSLGNDLGFGLRRQLPSSSGLTLVQLDKSSTGLANPGFWDWPAEMATYLAQYHPQLVVICLGGNDQQGIEVSGTALQFPSASWQSAYSARIRQMLNEATSAGAYVAWVGLPVMQQPSYAQGAALLDSLYQKAVATDADAIFIPTWSYMAGLGGAFASSAAVNGVRTTIRAADGVHLTYPGEDVLATYVIQQLASAMHVALAPATPAVITGRY
ncbi:MAG: DUF459 domain-containing protein [Acidobacteriota bacterium]|nr:DUF459 domain-containing protein [Acidobacteriota bacterium]